MDIRATVKQAMADYYMSGPGMTPIRNGYRRSVVVQTMTANKLATLAKVPSRTLYGFVNGTSPINSDALGNILDVLGICLAYQTPTHRADTTH